MDFGKIHFSIFPTIQFHIITRNIDHNIICISISIIIFPVSHPNFCKKEKLIINGWIEETIWNHSDRFTGPEE